MSAIKLKDRIESYMDASNYKLLARLPVIIIINGRSFNKVTSLLEKPFCEKFAEGMLSTTVRLCLEVEGALFAYQYSDSIVVVSRNDHNKETSPWYDNKIQKICSITSAIATQHFNSFMADKDVNIMGEALFTSNVFTAPNIPEAINTIIFNQQRNFYLSVQYACFYELLKKYDKTSIRDMLSDLSVDEKVDLLKQECDIDFSNYPQSFRRGVACYKVPKVIDDVVKNKWTVNTELPIFTKDQSFLSNIFKNGSDIFRGDNL